MSAGGIVAVALAASLCAVAPPAGGSGRTRVTGAVPADRRLDVNQAAEDALARLPFVGEVMATAIVEERALRGAFESLDDLSRIPGVTPDLIAAWRPWLVVGEGEGAMQMRAGTDFLALRAAGAPWQTSRRHVRAAATLRPGAIVTCDYRATATGSATTARLRTRGLTLAWTTGTSTRRVASARDASGGGALLRALDLSGVLHGVALESGPEALPWTLAWRTRKAATDAGGPESATGEAVAESLAVEDGGGRSRSGPLMTLGCATSRGTPVAAALVLHVDSRSLREAAVALAGRVVRPVADFHWTAWWQDVPRWHVAALSGVPELGWTWRVDADGVAVRRPLVPGARVARVAVALRSTSRRLWSARTDIAWEVRAPSGTRLRPAGHVLAHAEVVRAGAEADAPALDLRFSASAAQDPDVTLPQEWSNPRSTLSAMARPWARHPAAVLAGAVTTHAGGAWCGGWSVDPLGGSRARVRLHVLGHATRRGMVAPSWPLLPATVRPRGDGLDVVLDVRAVDDRDATSIQLGRGFAPQGAPTWWCQVRLGWPQGTGKAVL